MHEQKNLTPNPQARARAPRGPHPPVKPPLHPPLHLPPMHQATRAPCDCSCGSGKPRAVTLFAAGTLLGREACPWPMFLPGSDGYDPAFDFTKVTPGPPPPLVLCGAGPASVGSVHNFVAAVFTEPAAGTCTSRPVCGACGPRLRLLAAVAVWGAVRALRQGTAPASSPARLPHPEHGAR